MYLSRKASLNERIVISGADVACQSCLSPRTTQAAVAKTWVRPRSDSSCARASARFVGLSNHSSPIAAGSIENGTPAAASSRARAVLAEARMTGSAIAAMAADPQLVDRRGGLLDRAAGDVDNRPMLFGEDPPRLADLGPHCLDVGVIGAFVMVEHAEPVAAQMDQPLGIVGEPDDQWLLRAEQ